MRAAATVEKKHVGGVDVHARTASNKNPTSPKTPLASRDGSATPNRRIAPAARRPANGSPRRHGVPSDRTQTAAPRRKRPQDEAKSTDTKAGPNRRKPRRDRASIGKCRRTIRRPQEPAQAQARGSTRRPAQPKVEPDGLPRRGTRTSAGRRSRQSEQRSTRAETSPSTAGNGGEHDRGLTAPAENDDASRATAAEPELPVSETKEVPASQAAAEPEPAKPTPSGVASLGRASNDPRSKRRQPETPVGEEA